MRESYRFYRSIGYSRSRAVLNVMLDSRVAILILG